MLRTRRSLENKNLSDLADELAGPQPGSQWAHEVSAEFTRRVTDAQIRAAEAQVEAAKAARDAAEAARDNARWVLITLVVVGAATLVQAFAAVMTLISK